MKAVAAAFVILVAAGCTDSGARSTSSAATASASRLAHSPSSFPTGSISPVPDLPLSKISASCRLPVVISSGWGPATTTGGFISFPAATLKSDSTGTLQAGRTPEEFATTATPVLYGVSGLPLYDWSHQRWIPADVSETTAEGDFYAYGIVGSIGSGQSSIHVADVARATEKVITVASPSPPWAGGSPLGVRIDAFEGSGVYFSYPRMEAYPEGIWRLNVSTGTVSALSPASGVMAVQSGYAWLGRVDSRDPSPPRYARGGEFFDSITRLDLATGTETVWYYAPGEAVVVLGFDGAGRPLIGRDSTLGSPEETFRLIKTPGDTGTTIYSGPRLWLSNPLADDGRLWFGSYRGIYLWTATTGLRKVFAFNSNTQPYPTMFPAGSCR